MDKIVAMGLKIEALAGGIGADENADGVLLRRRVEGALEILWVANSYSESFGSDSKTQKPLAIKMHCIFTRFFNETRMISQQHSRFLGALGLLVSPPFTVSDSFFLIPCESSLYCALPTQD